MPNLDTLDSLLKNAPVTPNLDNIRLWRDALLSGEYTQGIGSLHSPGTNTWCCLGVACDVARKNGVELTVTYEEDSDEERFDDEIAFLPDKVAEWLGVDSCNPMLVDTTGFAWSATEWNDGKTAEFPEIGKAIESTWLTGPREESV